jgi:hypothetical protein
MATNTLSMIWVDANGFTRLTTFNHDGTSSGIIGQMLALINAWTQKSWSGLLNVTPTPTPSTGVYQSVQDAAVLSYQSASGAIAKLVLPAPLLSTFAADQQTVDPAALTALNTEVFAHMLDANGLAIVSYVGGFYQRSGKVLVGG